MNIEDISGLEEELASKAEQVHDHPTSDITGLVEALSNKAPIDHTHDISDFPDFTQAVGNFAPAIHGHSISQITDLTGQLAAKADSSHLHISSDISDLSAVLASRAPISHTHTVSDITGLQNSLNLKSNTGHVHAISEVTSLQETLNSKSNTGHFHAIGEITGLTEALTSAGRVTPDWLETDSTDPTFIANKPTLGTASSRNVGTTENDVAAGSHTHDASQITTGVLSIDRIPVIPGTQTIVSSGELSALTTEQQGLIVAGSNVVTSDGRRFVYSGVGDKTLQANYVLVSNSTVDYSEITNTPGNATVSTAGLMSSSDKQKLDGVANGANNYAHPSGDGNLHVPATGTTNNGRVLKAGATPGSIAWGSVSAAEVGAATTTHSHGNIDSNGRIGLVAGLPVVTGENGALTTGQSNAYASGTHAHGNLTNGGQISGASANRVMVTGANGAVGAMSASGTSGQVLTSQGSSAAPIWQDLPSAQTSIRNLSGGNNGSIPYQSGANTTTFLPGSAPASGFNLLRSNGTAAAPSWLNAGSIVTKNQDEYVATDDARTITKIQRITATAYATLSPKDPTTLYVVVG